MLKTFYTFLRKVVYPFVLPFILARKQYIYKKTLTLLHNEGIKVMDELVKKTNTKWDDKMLTIFKGRHSRKILEAIHKMPESNAKIVKELNNKKGDVVLAIDSENGLTLKVDKFKAGLSKDGITFAYKVFKI